MKLKLIYVLILAYQSFLLSYGCQNRKTCHDCVTDPNMCVWCASNESLFDATRCRPQANLDPKWCEGNLDRTDNASVVEVVNKEFSSAKGGVVQIKPQSLNVKLRVGQPKDFTFSFQGAKDYPVDLYMVLDASKTMTEIKETISIHTKVIFDAMQRMTQNVMMGFGTFVDKNTQPFTLNINKNQTYSFKNHINLTEDFKKLHTVVENVQMGANNDVPEGGFDALAQIIACDLNWRPQSRRIIVFFTDSSMHMVGDGRSANIFQPFDGKCHTDAEGIYTKELEMDYPSVQQINTLALNNDVSIIFALNQANTEDFSRTKDFYKKLTEALRGSKMTLISDDNLVAKMEESYKEISTRIQLDVSNNNNYDITFDPDCFKDSDNANCAVEPEERVDFKGTITLKKYTGEDTRTIDISVQGTKEKLVLNVKVITCSCEEDEEASSTLCMGQKYQCGVCICDKTRHGSRCQCKSKGDDPSADDESQCREWGAPAGTPVCSGRGKCNCGLCQCSPFSSTRFGLFCECDHKMCPGYNTEASTDCSGHGSCECINGRHICRCENGYEAEDCSCKQSHDMCYFGGKNCNNRGNCTCNACVCKPIPTWDARVAQDLHTCEIKPCPHCHSKQCGIVNECVTCLLDSDSEACRAECKGIVLEEKYDDLRNTDLNNMDWGVCAKQKVRLGCYINFVYKYDDNQHRILLRMQKEMDCAASYYTYGGILLATLVLIGILTLFVWKCLTRYYDRMEYEKFEKQHKEDLNAVSENPVYNEPTTTIRNPAFRRSIK